MHIRLLLVSLATAMFLLSACGGGGGGSGDGTGNFVGNAGGNPGTPPVDPGQTGSDPTLNAEVPPGVSGPKSRYALNNQCYAIRSNANDHFVTVDGSGYRASAETAEAAEPFYMRPSALGKYIVYDSNRNLITAADGQVGMTALLAAVDGSEWTLRGVGDSTAYPATPPFDTEPTPEYIAAYRSFETQDPHTPYENFSLFAASEADNLAVDDSGLLVAMSPVTNSTAQSFSFEPAENCQPFPEAQNNTEGETFSGTQPDGESVLGMADVHVHISSTTFLGNAQHGLPFHRFGVAHAIGDCEETHGPNGTRDAVNALFQSDFDGHATAGWPTFLEWPARDALTHEAIYWKWLERSWKAGLRLVVNDLVENQTLCELQRNIAEMPGRDCNSMNNATAQIGTMYGMQDYIDAQYGGRGEGWFRIVETPAQAREVIEDGKMAVVLGIEISNLFNCQLNYNPLRTQQPFEETGTGPLENSYGCAMTETGADNEINTQIERLHNLGVRQIITIHEFDNAFGGNGIFDDLVLNLGNRENTGGIPSDDLNVITSLLALNGAPEVADIAGNLDVEPPETATGEFWTTYDCPIEDETEGFSGYLFGSSGGSTLQSIAPPGCPFLGQNNRPGGPVACYPQANQCNARWLTPIGLYTYSKLMEFGFIFDIDHLEYEMKTQALELAEAQTPVYPFVSTHGTFGGTSLDQAERILRNGGHIYPSLGNGPQHIRDMEELREVWQSAGSPGLFAFGFGTDTNGLSAQSSPRENIEAGKRVLYPYTLFSGSLFDSIDAFDNVAPVTFFQPRTRDPDGNGRSWHLDMDGSTHHGMLSGLVQEMLLEGNTQQLQDLFNSAELYLRTWEKTIAAQQGIATNNGVRMPADPILRGAPVPDSLFQTPAPPAPPG